jgi:hypothetical protein
MLPSVRKPKLYRTALIRCAIATLRMAAFGRDSAMDATDFRAIRWSMGRREQKWSATVAQASRRGSYLPDQLGFRFSRNACKPSC